PITSLIGTHLYPALAPVMRIVPSYIRPDPPRGSTYRFHVRPLPPVWTHPPAEIVMWSPGRNIMPLYVVSSCFTFGWSTRQTSRFGPMLRHAGLSVERPSEGAVSWMSAIAATIALARFMAQPEFPKGGRGQ